LARNGQYLINHKGVSRYGRRNPEPDMIEPADILLAPAARGIPLTVIEGRDWEKKRRELPADLRGWADANGFKAQAGRVLAVPSPAGEVKQVLAGADASDPFALGKLSRWWSRAAA
jgi:hypothetical protein